MAVMSSFKQQCPSCEAMVSVKETMIGKKIECTKCKDKFVAERPEDEEDDAPQVKSSKKDTKLNGKKNTKHTKETGVSAKTPLPPGKKPKPAVEDDEEEDVDEVDELEEEEDNRIQTKGGKNKPSANGKSNGKPPSKSRDDEDDELDDDVDEVKKKKKKVKAGASSSNKLIIGLALAVVGVIILVAAAFFVMNTGKAPAPVKPGGDVAGGAPPPGGAAGGAGGAAGAAGGNGGVNPPGTDPDKDKLPPDIPKGGINPPVVSAAPLTDAELTRLSNLLPNDTEHVFHVYAKDVFSMNSPLREAAFGTPGALEDSELKRNLGFSVLAIDDIIVAEKYTAPSWKYTVLHFKEVIREDQLKTALKLEAIKLEGQTCYRTPKEHPWFDHLARISFGVPASLRALDPRPRDKGSVIRIHNSQTLIIGDEPPVKALLAAKGVFPMQSTKKPPPPPVNPNPGGIGGMPQGGIMGGPPMPGAMIGGAPPMPQAGIMGGAPPMPQAGIMGGAPPMPQAGIMGGAPPMPQGGIMGGPPPMPQGGIMGGPPLPPRPMTGAIQPEEEKEIIRFAQLQPVPLGARGAPPPMPAAGAGGGPPPMPMLMMGGGPNPGMVGGDRGMIGGGPGMMGGVPNPMMGGVPNPMMMGGGPNPNMGGGNPTPPTPPPPQREEMYMTIKPGLKAILDRMETRTHESKEKVIFSSVTDMDANKIDVKDLKDNIARRPRQFWDVTLLLSEQKPRIRTLGTGLIQKETLKFQLRNEVICAEEGHAKDYKAEMIDRTAYKVANFIKTMTKHEVKLPVVEVEKPAGPPDPMGFPPGPMGFPPPGPMGFPPRNPMGPPMPMPPNGQPPEEKKPAEITSSRITIHQDRTSVEFVLDLVLDNPALTHVQGITTLSASSVRMEMEASAYSSLRHMLSKACLILGDKGLPERDIPEGKLPPGAFGRDRAALITDREPRNRISWMAGLLPHMGHQNLYNKIQFNQSWRDSSNWMAGSTVVPQFLDPMYPDATRHVSVGDLPLDFAATHYVGIAGVGMDAASYKRGDPATAHKRGALSYDGSATLDEIRAGRGMSNVILMAQVPHDGVTGVSPWMAGGGATLRGVPEKNSIAPFVLSTDKNGKTINHQNKRGTYVMMTDGTVRFIDQNVSDDVFKAMCTIGGPAPKDFDIDKNSNTPLIPAPAVQKEPVKLPPPEKAPPVKKEDGALVKAIADAKASLQGDWVLKSLEHDGATIPPVALQGFWLSIKGDKITMHSKDQTGKPKAEEAIFTIDPLKSPKQIIVQETGKKQGFGIYEVSKDELRICLRDDESTKGYPTTFAAPANSQLDLMVLTRKK